MKIPPGFIFRPTDQVLIIDYLQKKVIGETLLPDVNNFISEKIIYGEKAEEPSQLFAGNSEDEYLYFFTKDNEKFVNSKGKRKERIAGNGTWRNQKKVEVFYYNHDNQKTLIGYRRNFTFVSKNKEKEEQKPEKISYIMHEFTSQNHEATEWTVCKIRKMITKNKDYREPSSVSSMPKKGKGSKRARTSTHELMLQSTTAPTPSTETSHDARCSRDEYKCLSSTFPMMPTNQQEQEHHDPCAESYDNAFKSQTDSLAYQLAETYTPAVPMMSSSKCLSHTFPVMPTNEQEQKHYHPCAESYDNEFKSQIDSTAYQLAETYTPVVPVMSSSMIPEAVNNLPGYSQPHQSDYFVVQPNHIELPPLEQESQDYGYPWNMEQSYTDMLFAEDDTDMDMLHEYLLLEDHDDILIYNTDMSATGTAQDNLVP